MRNCIKRNYINDDNYNSILLLIYIRAELRLEPITEAVGIQEKKTQGQKQIKKKSKLIKVMKSSSVYSCSPLKVNRRFGGTYRIHIQG
jgi:hypothetical protein